MKKLFQFAWISGLLLGLYACSNGGPARKPTALLHHPTRKTLNEELPAGTMLKVYLLDPLRSDTSMPGDAFLVSIAEPVVLDGVTILDSQTLIWGQVVDSVKSAQRKGSASLELTLTNITESERTIPIVTNV